MSLELSLSSGNWWSFSISYLKGSGGMEHQSNSRDLCKGLAIITSSPSKWCGHQCLYTALFNRRHWNEEMQL